MSNISKPYTYSTGAVIVAAEQNSNLDTIYNDYNGNITNFNISASAAIADSKLAQISTAGKVAGDALTSLANIPAGAGVIPVANCPSNVCPAGSLIMWTTTSAPTGWLICDGSAINRTTYATLFAVIGTTYGSGDGSTTFNIPNLQGKVAVGRDSGDTAFDVMGETGGAKTVDSSHTHTNPQLDLRSPGPGGVAGVAEGGNYYAYVQSGSTTNTGGSASLSVLQPYIVLNYIIKT